MTAANLECFYKQMHYQHACIRVGVTAGQSCMVKYSWCLTNNRHYQIDLIVNSFITIAYIAVSDGTDILKLSRRLLQ